MADISNTAAAEVRIEQIVSENAVDALRLRVGLETT
jgi:hypothetical protein